jgi:hypothetical protein
MERSVTTTFFLLEDVDLSLEVIVGSYSAGLAENHTTLDFILVNTTEEETDVITGFTFIEELAEHFNTGNDSLLILTETEELNFVTYVNDTSFDTTGSNCATTGDREHVFNRHQEGLVESTGRKLNPSVNSIHQLHDLVFPFRNTVQSAEGRTADEGSVFLELILSQEVAHFHLNEVEHFGIFNSVALVDEYNEAGHVHLTSEQDVLTSLGHRTVGSSYNDDSTIHLGSTGNHVLHIVSVTRAVNVSIVTVSSLILYVRGVNCNTTFLLFGSVVDLIERFNF